MRFRVHFDSHYFLISVPAGIKYTDESKREEMLLRAKKVLLKVRDILINTDLMKELENAYPIDMTMKLI